MKKEFQDWRFKMVEKNKQAVKYQPEYFIDDLAALMVSFQEKVKIMPEIEFNIRQKALISGLILGVAQSFIMVNEKLAEWGFMPKIT